MREFLPLLILVPSFIVIAEITVQALTDRPSAMLSGYANFNSLVNAHYVPYLIHRVGAFFTLTFMVGSIWLVVRNVFWHNPLDPLSAQVVRALKTLIEPGRIVRLSLFVVLFVPFMTAFVSFKSIIPFIDPFSWDSTFAAWDRTLHGGIDPWRITWAVFGSDTGTAFIDWVYGTWFVVIFSAPFACLYFDPNPERRMRFIVAHALLWIVLGAFLAAALASAGPCYVEAIHDDDFGLAPLMERLYALHAKEPLTAIVLQESLLQAFQGINGQFEGLSAMPSLHVAQVVLLALLAKSYHRVFGLLAWGYAGLIIVGSVHLGWHYALDGYVSALSTIALWWALGKVRFSVPASPSRTTQ
ncbi:phosphatase PAP2 family protein [Magnetovibrio sp. PR-2]|uniref:phosphatase PAP2 family protein n=1 Tax=Magnetovibrio sp. PR-2 TaxID=3120356 RepID=UPI002FCE3A93